MIKLYQYADCHYCERVRRKFTELGLEYEKIEVNPFDKPFAVTSTGGHVPVIDDNGLVMSDSSDIIKYLEEKYGKSA
ncbi:MAG: glutathione S-transferase N-terminal domain-containing protein [Candidatus Altimarinota bacterium]